ncbi:MAG: hypothetical protein CUN53_03005 [Phototrophicales bacterium]|nr:MAG: hypothetical protein CUN53_03005 [Phototrophicales bacterium]
MSNPLTQEEVSALVNDWYEKLDIHAPMVDILPLLSTGALYMKFPEQTMMSLAEFESWYQRVIRTFFDEVHTMQELNITISPDGQRADIKLVVYWEASVWTPPARFSKRLMMDAAQTWVVERAPDGRAVITSYIVDELRPKPGSADL